MNENNKDRWTHPKSEVGCEGTAERLVEQLIVDVRAKAEKNIGLLFSPQISDLHPEQKELLYEAWANIASDRNNAGLMVLGGLWESALREIIEIHHNVSIKGSLHDLVLYCSDHGLVDVTYLKFADECRDVVRNLWQHQLVEQITQGSTMPVVSLKTGKLDSKDGRKKFLKNVEKAKAKLEAGEVEYMDVTANRFLQFPRKQQIEAGLAPYLYNQTWVWLNNLTSRYLLSRHYEAARKNHGKDPVVFKQRKDKKGGTREWKKITPKQLPAFEKRNLPRFHADPKK